MVVMQACCMWRCRWMVIVDGRLQQHVASSTLPPLSTAAAAPGGRYIATMLYAMARAGAAPEAALAPLLASTKAQLPAFSGQQVANSLWALASLGRRDDELLALVARLMSAPHRPHASPQVCVHGQELGGTCAAAVAQRCM